MEVKKKERLFYLDFIRALSIIVIVTYHFAAGLSGATSSAPYLFSLSKGKWGILGVALFFMISGASLMYNYGEQLDLKKYYKKRFLGIYPTYWIAYTLVFLYSFWKYKYLVWPGPVIKLIFSFLGMDGYLNAYFPTFCLIGDWFLGCIVLIYLLFPLLRLVMKKAPKIFFGISLIIYLSVIFLSNFTMPLNRDLFVSIFSFLLGMYYIEYIKNSKIWLVIATLLLGGVSLYFAETPEMRVAVFWGNLAAYNLFIVLCYIGSKIRIQTIKNIVMFISKYSYFIFLLHHYTIVEIESHFADVTLDKYGTIFMYVLCWLVILVLSKIIYILNKKTIAFFANKEN